MDRHAISRILEEIGMLLEMKGEIFFKSKAYYDAARTIELLEEDIETLVAEDRLRTIKGFGEALTAKITELVTTGRLEYFEKLKASVPPGLMDMMRIEGLGPKKVKAIYDKLGIATVEELKQACLENRLAGIAGFGERTQAKILEGISKVGRYAGQYLFPEAMELAGQMLDALRESGLVIRCSEGGSLRRRKETVKDIDILASSADSMRVMDFFTSHPLVSGVISKGDTKLSVTLFNGINADLRVVEDSQYPYALHHFTGSREHNTALRRLARQNDLKMNEYGIFHGEEEEPVVCSSEEDIFGVFGMQYIPPELRENNGELEAALEGRLPVLLENGDIRGVIHMHSVYSDGSNTIEELVKACISRGYTYMGISDHSQTAVYAGGLKPDDIKRQHEEIDRLREKYAGFRIYKGIELDILPDGSVDYDEETLSLFDFTIASIHSSHSMDEARMTDRVIKALKNRFVTIFGHPTGRLLLSREPVRINMGEVIRIAAENKVILEINTNPHRLDLDWRYCKAARDAGCRFVLSPDAHSLREIDYIRYGVNVARKGWLRASDVVNTTDADGFGDILRDGKNI